jgi:hypothetical protein
VGECLEGIFGRREKGRCDGQCSVFGVYHDDDDDDDDDDDYGFWSRVYINSCGGGMNRSGAKEGVWG